MFKIILEPVSIPGFQKDEYARISEIDNLDGRWHDKDFVRQNAIALLKFIENKQSEDNSPYQYGLLSALVTVAAIAPLSDIATQVRTADMVNELLLTATSNDHDEINAISMNKFFQDMNHEAKRNNGIAPYTARWTDSMHVVSDELVSLLERQFIKTPTYEVLQTFKDNYGYDIATCHGSQPALQP